MLEVMLLEILVICNVESKKHLIKLELVSIKLFLEIIIR